MQNLWAVILGLIALVVGVLWLLPQLNTGNENTFNQIYQQSLDSMGGSTTLNAIESIRSIANASSPSGSYDLEVLSAREGRARVTFTNPDGSAAVFHANGNDAWTLDEEANPVALGDLDRAFILGHEFQMLPLEVDERFSGHQYVGETIYMGQDAVQFSASGEPNSLPYELFFDPVTGLMLGMSFPDFLRDLDESISIHFAEWCPIEQFQLPCKVVATDVGGEFVLTFNAIELNTVDVSLLEAPSKS